MDARILYVFAKEPRAGTVKTRLCPPLTFDQAERVYRALLVDTLALAEQVRGQLGGGNCEVVITTSPDEGCAELTALAARFGFAVAPQGDGDLGRRMWRALSAACVRDMRGIVVGSDCPELDPSLVVHAFDALDLSPAVLGPSLDGGYYLIGCRDAVPPVFDLDAAWGGPLVLAETRTRMRGARIACAELPERSDVDDFADLCRFAESLARDRDAAHASPASTALLREFVAEGLLPSSVSGLFARTVEDRS